MIGYIQGKVLEISEHSLLILPEGWVGYEIAINEVTFASLATQETAELYIYHHISEVTQALYGFETLQEKKLFLELIKISGIGGKVALQILSLWENRLILAIQQDDKKVIEGIKWIGKKMAEKIILELKDKDFVQSYIWENVSQNILAHQTSLPASLQENISATLVSMGYNMRDIQRVFEIIPAQMKTAQEILPFMIRELS